MAKTTNSNFGGGWQWAGADGDAPDRTDIAGPAEDLDLHDHSGDKGLAVRRVSTSAPTASGEFGIVGDQAQVWGGTSAAALLVPVILSRDVTEAEVVSTTDETTVFSYTVPGGTLGTTGILRLTFWGDYLNNDGAGRNLTIQVKYGGTVIGLYPTSSVTNGATRRLVMGTVLIAAANSASAQRTTCFISIGDLATAAAPPATNGALSNGPSGHNALAITSASDQALIITVTHGTSSANISFRLFAAIVEKL